MIDKNLKVLVFAAHPDDADLCCGGFLWWLIHERNATVKVIVLTDGYTAGDPEKRAQEQKRAAKYLGYTVRFCNFKDGELTIKPDLVTLLTDHVKKFKPDIVLSHSIQDHHQDHRAVSLAAQSALRNSIACHIEFASWSKRICFDYNFLFTNRSCLGQKVILLSYFSSQADKCYMKSALRPEKYHIRYMEI